MRLKLKFALRRARLRLLRGLRHHYMLGFSVLALGVALAGTGAFEADRQPVGKSQPPAPRPIQLLPVVPSGPTRGLIITFALVRTEAERDLLNWSRTQLIHREWLSTQTMQALVAGTPAEEAAALRVIEAARAAGTYADVLVEDLRGN